MYGHMDKQPFGEGWNTDPCDPVVKDGYLYGRGGADDGYALFSAVLAVKSCQETGSSHPRILITIEGSEEGELDDLIYYLAKYKHLLGSPGLVMCLDALAATYDTITVTTSLRGCLNFDLKVQTTDNHTHSGYSGIIPSAYMIAINQLSKVIDFNTQEVLPKFQVEVPQHRIDECKVAAALTDRVSDGLTLCEGVKSLAHKSDDEKH